MAGVTLLHDEAAIRERVRALAREIVRALHPSDRDDLLVLVILKGGFVFGADLVRALRDEGVVCRVDFLRLASYGAATAAESAVRSTYEPEASVAGRRVLLVDDILDTGATLAFGRDRVLELGAEAVRTCVLLDKPARRVRDLRADHAGFVVEDRFVVGYGLDHAERYRDLPYLGVVDA